MTTCTVCGTELTGELDTYGDVGHEMCMDCWYESPELEAIETENGVWGLAPHIHDLSITGSMIGSTVFTALPEPDQYGYYWIADRSEWFQPGFDDFDKEGDPVWQGMWYRQHPVTGQKAAR